MPAADSPEGGRLRTVITYLEMTAPPETPEVHPPLRKIALLRAERPTLSFYRYLYDAVGRQWMWVDRKRLDDEALRAIIHDEQVEIYVLYVGGVPAGYVELDFRRPAEVEIAYFGLVPEFMGQGLGPYLLSWAIRRAWRDGPRRVWVHTCTFDHPAALRLYQRMGFVPYDRREAEIEPAPEEPERR